MKRRTSLAVTVPVLALSASFAACAKATGEVHGGDDEVTTTPAAFVGCDLTETIDAGSGTKWSDLYRDLFGPTSAAKCANPACHGSEDGAGFKTSSFKCFDEKGCRQGMLDYGLVSIERDPKDPESSALVGIVRHCDEERKTKGTMPDQPRSYYFSRASLARIEDWIRGGAQDN
jgi:hypothetical protein